MALQGNVIECAPEHMWVYHDPNGAGEIQCFPEEHAIMQTMTEMCMTHRPTPVCTCGRYTIAWATADDEPTTA